jgi:hypothetical protein
MTTTKHRHYIESAGLWCVHETEEDFYLEQGENPIYDENNNCIDCMQYVYDPHLKNCKAKG